MPAVASQHVEAVVVSEWSTLGVLMPCRPRASPCLPQWSGGPHLLELLPPYYQQRAATALYHARFRRGTPTAISPEAGGSLFKVGPGKDQRPRAVLHRAAVSLCSDLQRPFVARPPPGRPGPPLPAGRAHCCRRAAVERVLCRKGAMSGAALTTAAAPTTLFQAMICWGQRCHVMLHDTPMMIMRGARHRGQTTGQRGGRGNAEMQRPAVPYSTTTHTQWHHTSCSASTKPLVGRYLDHNGVQHGQHVVPPGFIGLALLVPQLAHVAACILRLVGSDVGGLGAVFRTGAGDGLGRV
jgi:hypothetical protein